MPNLLSDLSSQGVALSAVIERQRLELRIIGRIMNRSSIVGDFEHIQRIAGASSIVRDLERMQRIAGANSFVRDLERIRRFAAASSAVLEAQRYTLALSETNVAREFRQIAEALQTQQQQAIDAQRLLSRSRALQALDRVKRVTELQHRQLTSIARAASGSHIASAIKRMDLAFSSSALARDIRGIAEYAGRVQAQAEAARRALAVSLNFRPLERMGASVLLGLRQSLARVAEALPLPSRPVKQERSRSARIKGTSKASSTCAVQPVSKEAYSEWRISVFLAKLPTFVEPLDDPAPKHRMH